MTPSQQDRRTDFMAIQGDRLCALRAALVRFVRGYRGHRKNGVTQEQIVAHFSATADGFVKAALAETCRRREIVCLQDGLRVRGHCRYVYVIPEVCDEPAETPLPTQKRGIPQCYRNATIDVDGIEVEMVESTYGCGGRLAIELVCTGDCPELFARLTVNIPEAVLAPGEFLVKTWGENAASAAACLGSGMFVDTGKRVRTGYVEAQVWRFAEATEVA